MTDNDLITKLGGVSALARRLKTTPSRVCNWRKRGIPARVRLQHADIFGMPKKTNKKPTAFAAGADAEHIKTHGATHQGG